MIVCPTCCIIVPNTAICNKSHPEDTIQDSFGFLIRGCTIAGKTLNAIQAADVLSTTIVSLLQQAQQVKCVQAGNNGMGKSLAMQQWKAKDV